MQKVSKEQLETITLKELKGICKELELVGYGRLNKEQIFYFLKEAGYAHVDAHTKKYFFSHEYYLSESDCLRFENIENMAAYYKMTVKEMHDEIEDQFKAQDLGIDNVDFFWTMDEIEQPELYGKRFKEQLKAWGM